MNVNLQLPKRSPCFVHSHLDKGASLQDWLREKEQDVPGIDLGVAKSLQRTKLREQTLYTPGLQSINDPDPVISGCEDEDTHGGSLTRQLAETAMGVRELSRQLGRARIRTNIQSVLIVTKARDNRLIKLTRELALYLMLKPRYGNRGLVVYVDHQLRTSRRFDAAGIQRDYPELFRPIPRRKASSSSVSSFSGLQDEGNGSEEGQLRYWTSDMCNRSAHLFDFVITLGGDGTVLFTSWLFQRVVPPVLPFALGSLGFLTNFDFADHPAVVDSCMDAGIRVNLRMRFTCTVYRAIFDSRKHRKAVKKGETGEIMMKDMKNSGWEAVEGGWSGTSAMLDGGKCMKDKEIMCFTTRPVETFEVLNDLVVDRGPSPYVSLLELFGDEHHMTTVQADGLCVATPTGSTAYSLSAGGSLVHPEIPAILITPICPHTLSFRPMLLPDSMELRICVPYNSRSTAWASFDGRGRVELKQGDHVKITASKYPFPTVCADKQSTDWFHSISRTLKWNERERQKSFVVVEEGPSKRRIVKENVAPDSQAANTTIEETEEEENDDEDDFDIHDSSPEASTNEVPAHVTNEQSYSDVAVGTSEGQERSLPHDYLLSAPELAALALFKGQDTKYTRRAKSRSRSRSGLRSGVDTPGRFAGPARSAPHISQHHVQYTRFDSGTSSPTLSDSSSDSLVNMDLAQRGARDDIHNCEQYSSGRSRIPKDREFDDNLQTPTVPDTSPGKNRHHKVNSKDRHELQPIPCRAFAVWGNDESDSNASDNDDSPQT
ncbi:ATP-NAD kinase-like domain-containing protein [Scleroderma yunnanense]